MPYTRALGPCCRLTVSFPRLLLHKMIEVLTLADVVGGACGTKKSVGEPTASPQGCSASATISRTPRTSDRSWEENKTNVKIRTLTDNAEKKPRRPTFMMPVWDPSMISCRATGFRRYLANSTSDLTTGSQTWKRRDSTGWDT